ncbi:MAG: hypothetical protein HY699_21025 [Deltaproteobacteria bacterium]|nr:hypothetical protein [Deltaproteobacteria bacterium]
MNLFMFGATAMAWAVVGLFFLRFWKETADRLFLIFALAFWVLALGRVALSFGADASEGAPVPYLIRLLGFCLILAAVWDKNRSGRSAR